MTICIDDIEVQKENLSMRVRTVCFSLLLMLLALFPLAARVSAQDDQFQRCGTRYPGWWKHIIDPRGILTISVENIVLTSVDKAGGLVTYKVTFALSNRSRANSPAARLDVTHEALATKGGKSDGGYWNPDDTFNPNNPGNPYAVVGKGAQVVLLPAVQSGKIAFCDGSVRVSFKSNVQLLIGNVAR
jgi:hypothetical protein